MSEWDFYFEKTGLGVAEGANIPSAEFFTTEDFESHLVREMIQNSLDAHAGEGPVRVEFEMMNLRTKDLPGIDTLRGAASRAEGSTRGDEGHGALLKVVESAHQETIPVLRIGDYGTTGLTGKESKDCPRSALSTLTRGVGISSSKSGRGGSFGIGSAVAMVGSTMRTVAYVSLPNDRPEQVFTMTTRLASFRDSQEVDRAATGFYICTTNKDDFEYKRDLQRHAPFHARTEPGTDTYILGYRQLDSTTSLESIRKAVIRNFFVAILEEALEVSVMSGGQPLVIDTAAVHEVLGGDDKFSAEMAPFIRAYGTDPEHIVRDRLKQTGSCELRIHFDESMRAKPATMLMRQPRMLITDYKPQVPFRYAAVFICRGSEGDKKLRLTEPAQHNKWSTDGVRGNPAAVKEIRDFIRRTLLEKAPETLQSSTTVAGLARLLPKPTDAALEAGAGTAGHGASAPGTPQASPGGIRRPRTQDPEAFQVVTNKPVSVTVTSSATAGAGDSPGTTGRGTKPSSRKKQKHPGGPRTGVGQPDGASRRLQDVRMKSFVSAGAEATTVVLVSDSDQRGNLTLMAKGMDGKLVPPTIVAATQLDGSGTARQLQVEEGTIKDVAVAAGSRTRLQVRFNGGGIYRLTVKEG